VRSVRDRPSMADTLGARFSMISTGFPHISRAGPSTGSHMGPCGSEGRVFPAVAEFLAASAALVEVHEGRALGS
jgi:hypothetical protein